MEGHYCFDRNEPKNCSERTNSFLLKLAGLKKGVYFFPTSQLIRNEIETYLRTRS
jgi:hypothetical protein